ncbi:UDP-N-acetylmuramoyl-L-alanine--D-glutamate ligase [Methylobacterium sp. Leaf466]|uniref:UDP-N-acetylmuramoyl-L-alanine--D-glutamate ligase n=1 Tax=Methylobacterium sp. Leaf466 TaxID=1736386 RepID=UPI0006F814A4|nr:UDP-N-acetylmuramoyl-L-alanine--D-glutamate ligase [Methylobacterium sp. Leaf466]KQT84459.1 UDP-N-acetylmuramoylalanine--D-glutamate ligase [Methylobacterium sp. Leaf466]
MTPSTTFAGRTVALFGLGGSGLATALSLKAGGATVVACDDSAEGMARAQAQGIATADLRDADWSSFAALILAPGVPLTHPAPHWTVGMAKAAGIEIVGDIELFCRERRKIAPGAPFVAITGTNGKSTTTALVAHVLAQAGFDVQMGGNIGTAILSLAPPAEDRVHVIEMSSFQIDLTPTLDQSIGLLLNITPDHLDRHGTMENYAAIKERLVAGAALAVVGIDDGPSRAIAGRHEGPLVRVHVGEPEPDFDGLSAHGAAVWRGDERIADLTGIGSLRGAHNGQNAAFATACAEALGIDAAGLQRGLSSFPGLPHRMEEVGRRGRVLFVNDSKATNADSADKALCAFHDVHWILGGKAKEGGIQPLAPLFGRIAHAYLIGAASDDFAKTLEGRVPYTRCETLDVATRAAAQAAAVSDASEPVVLLSPACASYDQFRSFEERGDRFRDLVRAIL